MDEADEEERENRLKAIKYLAIFFIIAAVSTVFIRLYIGRMDPQYLPYLLIPLILIILISVFYKKINFATGIFMGMTALGMIFIILGITLADRHFIPITGALVMGAIIFIGPWLIIKSGWVDRLNASVLDDVKGCWEMDNSGNLHKTKYPMNVKSRDVSRNNIYALFVNTSLHSKKKISLVDMNVFNFQQRNREHEKKLLPLIRIAIEMNFNYDVIEGNGGMDMIMNQLIWEEIFGDS